MYAFVDVAQYQIVGTGATVDEAKKNYRLALNMEEIDTGTPLEEQTAKGTMEAIADVVISGNTQYYFTLRGQDVVYAADISVYEKLPFLKAGDMVEFTYQEPEGSTVKVVTGFIEE